MRTLKQVDCYTWNERMRRVEALQKISEPDSKGWAKYRSQYRDYVLHSGQVVGDEIRAAIRLIQCLQTRRRDLIIKLDRLDADIKDVAKTHGIKLQ